MALIYAAYLGSCDGLSQKVIESRGGSAVLPGQSGQQLFNGSCFEASQLAQSCSKIP